MSKITSKRFVIRQSLIGKNETMCKDKYNETILDYLYEEIVVELTN